MTNVLRILQLDSSGQPAKWISWQDAAIYYAKGLISFEPGSASREILGGDNRVSGLQSRIVSSSIIAVKGKVGKRYGGTPALTNKDLFSRDRHMCAYCGKTFSDSKLTRDHVHPRSKGGPDKWENVVAACHACNQKKDDKTLEQAGMTLLYVPYAPSRAEYLILENRNILADQMEFLLNFIPENSRVRKDFQEKFASLNLA